MPFLTRSRLFALVSLVAIGGCNRNRFQPLKFASHEALYEASLRELNGHHWDHAIQGFEKLTTDLSARDPILPQAYYYLGVAHMGRREYILAAQSFSRVAENFPEDTLADDATFESGVAYTKLWRRPQLDPEYGQTARNTFESFLAAYPDSPLHDKAQKEIDRLDEWFGTKEYFNGVTYYRRKAYDSAIIYFRDVVKKYPRTDASRKSLVKLVQSYRAIKYRDDVAETCGTLAQRFAGDKDAAKVCRGVKPITVADSTARAPSGNNGSPSVPPVAPVPSTTPGTTATPPLER